MTAEQEAFAPFLTVAEMIATALRMCADRAEQDRIGAVLRDSLLEAARGVLPEAPAAVVARLADAIMAYAEARAAGRPVPAIADTIGATMGTA